MHTYEFDPTAKATPSSGDRVRKANQAILSPQHGPGAQPIGWLSSALPATAHASLINHAAGTQPQYAIHSLLHLQRCYGNRYVQCVLALARQADSEAEVLPEVEEAIQRACGGGQALDSGARRQMESAFGVDFSDVRVHTGTQADRLNRTLSARAFTTGQDIFFRDGEYRPGSSSGRELLAHELTHVVQQTSGIQQKLTVSSPGDRYEQEADEVSRAIMQHEQPIRDAHVQRLVAEVRPNQLAGICSSHQAVVHRKDARPINLPGMVITADPWEAKSKFARIRESIQNYSDNTLDYLSIQFFSAMTSFRIWYDEQPKADASFFNAVIDFIKDAAPLMGAPNIITPIGSIIQLVAQESARTIQAARDEFAASLIASANNFQAGLQEKLRAKIPDLLANGDPALWEEIELRASIGEDWQPLLHEKAGLPRPGVNYRVRLLSELIFKYRQWELSQKPRFYQGIYSLVDPYLQEMRQRAEVEAYIKSGLPIPGRLKKYARAGERVEGQ